MRHWKVWFFTPFVRFGIEFKGNDYSAIVNAAALLARQLSVGFDYDIDEIKQ